MNPIHYWVEVEREKKLGKENWAKSHFIKKKNYSNEHFTWFWLFLTTFNQLIGIDSSGTLGQVDDITLWNRVLSPQEIHDLYDQTTHLTGNE